MSLAILFVRLRCATLRSPRRTWRLTCVYQLIVNFDLSAAANVINQGFRNFLLQLYPHPGPKNLYTGQYENYTGSRYLPHDAEKQHQAIRLGNFDALVRHEKDAGNSTATVLPSFWERMYEPGMKVEVEFHDSSLGEKADVGKHPREPQYLDLPGDLDDFRD